MLENTQKKMSISFAPGLMSNDSTGNTRASLSVGVPGKDGRRASTVPSPVLSERWNGVFRTVWDCISLIWLLYHFITLPLRLVLYTKTEALFLSNLLPWLAVDIVMDLFFLCDILLRLFCFGNIEYVDGVRSILLDAVQARARYRSSGLVLDVIAALPLDLLAFAEPQLLPLFRLNRLLRFSRVFEYATHVCHAVEVVVGKMFGMTRWTPSSGVWRSIFLFLILLGMMHWVGLSGIAGCIHSDGFTGACFFFLYMYQVFVSLYWRR